MTPGTRLVGGPGVVYELTGPGWETDRHAYLRVRRRFRNFRYPAEALDEAPDDESLDVLLRRPLTGKEPEAARAAFERDTVLSSAGLPWFLDVIDWIEPQDASDNAPWLVAADPHAPPLSAADPAARVVFGCEALAMLDALHRSGLALGAIRADDFLYAGPGRWYYLGTDRIHPMESPREARDDLSHWARLTEGLLRDDATDWTSMDLGPDELKHQARWLSERVRHSLKGDQADRTVEDRIGP